MLFEQTIALLGRTTGFTAVCQACSEQWPRNEYSALTVSGTLRLDQDQSWTTCPRGHRIHLIRAGRAVHSELTTPLW